MKPCGCDVRLRWRVRSLSGVCRVVRQAHMHALLWCMCLTLCFCDRGTVRSPCIALRDASRRLFPTLRDSVTPHPSVTLCRPTSGVRQGDSRAPFSPCREKKFYYSGPRSPLSPCRDPHDTAWVLCGVSATALQTRVGARSPELQQRTLCGPGLLRTSSYVRAWSLQPPLSTQKKPCSEIPNL